MNPTSTTPDILKHQGEFHWQNVQRQDYKSPGNHWKGVSRTELIAEPNRPELPLHVRYFEIEPQGYSSREKHAHEHVVIVTRGQGAVEIEGQTKTLAPGDIVHVRSWQTHQFLNSNPNEPFGFYCLVPADRDRPVLENNAASACEFTPSTPTTETR